ncbi:MAG: hypothetical protein HY675_00580 [Chloroflexi bacterium]|nr:hypothetical protein [Chloroflexota bacterium]
MSPSQLYPTEGEDVAAAVPVGSTAADGQERAAGSAAGDVAIACMLIKDSIRQVTRSIIQL